jgi:TolA-binding protein
LLRQRKFDLAAEEYERFLATRPTGQDAEDARFGLANARLFQGRHKDARKAFQEFLETAPKHPRARAAWYRLGELALMLGELSEARKALEAFVAGPARHPNLETAWTYLGDVCFGLNDLPAARSAYERSLADYPKGQLADRTRYGLGRTLAGLGESDAAMMILSRLAREGGSDWIDRAWLQLGKTQLASGHLEAAAQSFEALGRSAPRSALLAEANLGRSEALSRLGRLDEAEKLLLPLIAEGAEPVAPRAVLAMAALEIQQNRPDAARKVLDEGLSRFSRSPLVPAFLFRSAEAIQKQGGSAEAKARFLDLAETHPEDPWADDAVARAAGLALEAKDHVEALRLARAFPKRFPDSSLAAEVQLVEARALMAGGHSQEALGLLERLVGTGREGGPTDNVRKGSLAGAAVAAARYDLALAYRACGQAAKADALLASLASDAKNPVSADARFLVGQNLVDQGRFAEAVDPLKQYLASSPQAKVADYAMAHLAVAQLGIGRFEDAWQTVIALAERFPRSAALPPTRLRLAETAIANGQGARAAEQFRLILAPVPQAGDAAGQPRAAVADPATRGRALVGLGRSLGKLGKPTEAATVFGQFLESAGTDALAPAVALDRAVMLEASGKSPAALDAYRLVSDRYAKSAEAVLAELARARLLARTGGAEEAAKAFAGLLSKPEPRKTLAAAGETTDGLLAERGWALSDAGKTGDADAVFAELLKSFPESRHAVDSRFHLAESANQSRNHKEVVRLLSPLATPAALKAQAAHGPPEAAVSRVVPLVLYRLGRSQIELGDWDGAAETFDRLVHDFPGHARHREARYLQAEAALRRDQASAAEAIFAALETEPPVATDPPGFVGLIRARHIQSLLALKRWKEALARADSLRSELPSGDPAIAELDFARGRALLGLARPDEARQALQAVIDARRGGDLAAQAHLMQGETYFHQDRYREALRDFLKVDILYDAPRWQAAALFEAGKVYERLGQWSDAVETYDRLCTRFPDDSRVQDAKVRLAAARKQAKAATESRGKVF